MSLYLLVKLIHIIFAAFSFSGFVIRGIWMIQSSPLLSKRWVRMTPHIIDTLLLASAILLVILTLQYPGPVTWLNAKLAGLLIYIILGSIALRYGRTRLVRILAWCTALLAFAYIVMVALNKNALVIF